MQDELVRIDEKSFGLVIKAIVHFFDVYVLFLGLLRDVIENF